MRDYTSFNDLAQDWDDYLVRLRKNVIAEHTKEIERLLYDRENDQSDKIAMLKEWIQELEQETK